MERPAWLNNTTCFQCSLLTLYSRSERSAASFLPVTPGALLGRSRPFHTECCPCSRAKHNRDKLARSGVGDLPPRPPCADKHSSLTHGCM